MCDICGSADRLGLGTCVSCASPGSDALLFLHPSKRRADRRVLEAWLVGALDGAVTRNEAREAAEGLRPVVSLPASAAGRAAGVLTLRGVGAVPVLRKRAWRRVPRGFVCLAGVTGGVGLFVGLTGTPIMLVLAPVFSGLLIFAALKQMRLPVWRPEPIPILELSPPVEARVRATLARLPQGRARQRLKDLVHLAGALLESDELPAREDFTGAANDLLVLACDAVVDLDQLDRTLEALERGLASDTIDGSLSESTSEAERIRGDLIVGLDEALATLGRAQASTTDSTAELVKIARRLAQEATHRSEAWHEVRRLVG